MLAAIAWGGFAAAALLVGYLLALRGLSNRIVGLIMGVGAGALISAIAYELIPESALEGGRMALGFSLGAATFFVGDLLVDNQGGDKRKGIVAEEGSGSGLAIYLGTLLDNIPESIVLGMGLALGGAINIAFMVSVFISNIPEGVAGTLNMAAAGRTRSHIFWMWFSLVAISALCAGLGYGLVSWLPNVEGLFVQAFAAGAMLTMLADAMMPEAFEHGGKLVGLFTVLGFLVAAVLATWQ